MLFLKGVKKSGFGGSLEGKYHPSARPMGNGRLRARKQLCKCTKRLKRREKEADPIAAAQHLCPSRSAYHHIQVLHNQLWRNIQVSIQQGEGNWRKNCVNCKFITVHQIFSSCIT